MQLLENLLTWTSPKLIEEYREKKSKTKNTKARKSEKKSILNEKEKIFFRFVWFNKIFYRFTEPWFNIQLRFKYYGQS